MKNSSFAEVDPAAVLDDLASTLSQVPGTVTEFSFAERGTSKFNMAIYVSKVSRGLLEDLISRPSNVAFLADCEKSLMNVGHEELVFRQVGNRSLLRKSIVSFDIDFKDIVVSLKSEVDSYNFAVSLANKILTKARSQHVPIWLINFSGNGLHIHFKLKEPLSPLSPMDYQDKYANGLSCLLSFLDPR